MDLLLQIGWSNALGAAVLAVAAALLGKLCRRPALTHSLWLLVLLKLVMPPFVPVSVPRPVLWEDQVTETVPASPTSTEAKPYPVEAASLSPEGPQGSALPQTPAVEPTPLPAQTELRVGVAPANESLDAAALPTPETVTEALPLSWQTIVGCVWLAGSLAWILLAGWRLYCFQRLLRYTQLAPAEIQNQAVRLARHLGLARCPGVWLTPAAVSPMLWALLGPPRLLLPASLWAALTDEERDTLLLHELAHWRRRDHWVRGLEILVMALYWWHPVVWWARRELREAEEQCCDGWVLATLPAAAPAYARTLVETVAFLSKARPALPLAASGIGQVTILKRRLTMIMRGTRTAQALNWVTFLLVLAFGALLLPLWPTLAEPVQPPAVEVQVEDPLLQVAEPVTFTQQSVPQPAPTRYSRTVESSPSSHDEIEVLQAQLQVKLAETAEVKARIRMSERRLDRVKNLATRGAISNEELENAKDEVDLLKAQLEPKQAQVNEASIRLRQARRRGAGETRRPDEPTALTPPATSPRYAPTPTLTPLPAPVRPPADPTAAIHGLPAVPAPAADRYTNQPAPVIGLTPVGPALPRSADTAPERPSYPRSTAPVAAARPSTAAASSDHEQRLRNLEQKMDTLISEIIALRRELRPTRSGDSPRPKGDAIR